MRMLHVSGSASAGQTVSAPLARQIKGTLTVPNGVDSSWT